MQKQKLSDLLISKDKSLLESAVPIVTCTNKSQEGRQDLAPG